jgi:hypothetical protein
MSGQLHAPAALPPGKWPLVHIGQEAGWASEPVWMQWWGEKFLAPTRTGMPDYPAQSPAPYHWAIPAPDITLLNRKLKKNYALKSVRSSKTVYAPYINTIAKSLLNWECGSSKCIWYLWVHTSKERKLAFKCNRSIMSFFFFFFLDGFTVQCRPLPL